jgi:hypothetical protein
LGETYTKRVVSQIGAALDFIHSKVSCIIAWSLPLFFLKKKGRSAFIGSDDVFNQIKVAVVPSQLQQFKE